MHYLYQDSCHHIIMYYLFNLHVANNMIISISNISNVSLYFMCLQLVHVLIAVASVLRSFA